MGAFFLCKKNQSANMNQALEIFDEMGFASPAVFETGEWVVCAYSRMRSEDKSCISCHNCTMITAGTPIYKGMDTDGSLDALLEDYLSEKIDYQQLIGQYTILFCQGNTIEILCDPLGCKHMFTDSGHGILSSHMLPLCQCITSGLHINKKALYEKLLTGIIMSPNTVFEEIIQIDRQTAEQISQENNGIKFIQTNDFQYSGKGYRSFSECLAEQANTLRSYFEQLDKACKQGVDLGLSGGYDSRLVLACLYRFNKAKMHLHSHATENVHRQDLSIANQMAEYVGIPCHTVATKKLSHCDHIDDVLRKSVLYFDGRSSFSIGGCGEVYTASYRKESTENTPFTLTGVGGELYRNVFDIGFRSIRFNRFMEEKIFSESFRKAVSEQLYHEIKNDIIDRAASKLGIDEKSKQSKLVAHRYYCEIMMPEGQGTALDAYNQVSCCIAPFLEPSIISRGYRAIPFHHSGGEFEGKLIDFIDPGLAAITSTYGYPIGKRPIINRMKESLRTLIPTSVWNQLAAISIRRKESYGNAEKALDELYANSPTLKEAYMYLTELLPEIDLTKLILSGEEIRRIQFVAMTLYYFRERIRVN